MLDGWLPEVGAMVETCQNAPFGASIIDFSAFQGFEQACRAIAESEAQADWNDIPQGLRELFDQAVSPRGLIRRLFDPAELAKLAEGRNALDRVTQSAELKAIREQWEAISDTENGPAPIRNYARLMKTPQAKEYQKLQVELEASRQKFLQKMDQWFAARDALEPAWFFKDFRRGKLESAEAARRVSASNVEAIEARIKEWDKKNKGMGERIRQSAKEREQYISDLNRELRARYKKISQPVSKVSGDARLGRAAVLHERMVRVARFMRLASPQQKQKYLSLLKCELEDL
jgi:hypothetical protein